MNNTKKLGLVSALLLGTASIQAAQVSPESAMGEALSFRTSSNGYFKKAAAATPQLTLAYTATGDAGNCFYVFNEKNGGFTIVTADDRLPRVIGFSENGEFDYDRLPDNMKWWLSQYTDEITAFLKEDPKLGKQSIHRAKASDKKEIKPLLTSLWNQTAPYNDLCPLDPRTGQRSVTGCVATAMAQVMRHYEWPVNPTGSNAGYIFTGTTLDWENMLDSYKTGQYNSTQSSAVAELMRQCGASVNMMYSSYMSGAYSSDVPVALYTYFDYDISMRMQFRDYHTMKEWNDIVYAEIEANRPVYYSGNSAQGGHAFVCDGYLSNNFFHFNWGWGGYQDGYFLLNSLNPDSGGTGSYAGGYNANQTILTGVIKNQNNPNAHQQVTMLCSGNFTWASGNTFRVTGSQTQDLIYNPLAYNIKVTLGLKITNVDNPENVTYTKASGTNNFGSYYGTTEIVANIPNLPNGKYHVSPAIYTEYNEWEDIQTPYGYQRYVTLNVDGGNKTFINEGASVEGKAQLIAGTPQSLPGLFCNAPKAYRVTVSNVGEADYFGEVTLSLWYEDDKSGDGDEETRSIAIPSGGSMDVDFYLANTAIKPGNYSVTVYDNTGFEISEPVISNYPEGNFSKFNPGVLNFYTITPSFPTTGGELGISMEVENTRVDDFTTDLEIALLKASDFSEVTTVNSNSAITFQGLVTTNLSFAPRNIPIEPGDYYWVVRDLTGNWLSLPMPVKAYGPVLEENGIAYKVTNKEKKEAMVLASRDSNYSGTVVIPASLGGNKVTLVQSDAFIFSDELTDVRFPAGVTEIENGQFYGATKLKSLTVNSPNPPVLPIHAFADDAPASITLSTASGRENIYKRTSGWDAFNMSSWSFDFGAGISADDLQKDPATGAIYEPYYVNERELLTFKPTKPSDKSIQADWDINGTKGSGMFWGFVRLPALNGANGSVSFQAVSDTGIEAVLGENEKADVYSLAGMLLLRDADADKLRRLPKGIYIVNGRKLVINTAE